MSQPNLPPNAPYGSGSANPPGIPGSPMGPGGPPGAYPLYPAPPQRSNGFAIASLICSILGFCVVFIGGVLGIIFAIVGLRKARDPNVGGHGLALTGLIIGVVSLMTSGLIVGFGAAGFMAAVKLAAAPRAAAEQYMTDLSQGNVAAAQSVSTGLTSGEIQAQSDALQSMGSLQKLQVTNFQFINNDWTLSGTARFSNGSKGFTMTLVNQGGIWKVQNATFR